MSASRVLIIDPQQVDRLRRIGMTSLTDTSRGIVIDMVQGSGYTAPDTDQGGQYPADAVFRHPSGSEVNIRPGRMQSTPSGFLFISYSRRDHAYVKDLADYLKANNVPAWYDREIQAGELFDAVLQAQIDLARAVIVILSPASIESPWVQREISYAISGGKLIVPVMLHPVRLPFSLSGIHYEDLTGERLPSGRFLEKLQGIVM